MRILQNSLIFKYAEMYIEASKHRIYDRHPSFCMHLQQQQQQQKHHKKQ